MGRETLLPDWNGCPRRLPEDLNKLDISVDNWFIVSFGIEVMTIPVVHCLDMLGVALMRRGRLSPGAWQGTSPGVNTPYAEAKDISGPCLDVFWSWWLDLVGHL